MSYNKKIVKVSNNNLFCESGEKERFDILTRYSIRNINEILNTNYKTEYFTNKTIYISSTLKNSTNQSC